MRNDTTNTLSNTNEEFHETSLSWIQKTTKDDDELTNPTAPRSNRDTNATAKSTGSSSSYLPWMLHPIRRIVSHVGGIIHTVYDHMIHRTMIKTHRWNRILHDAKSFYKRKNSNSHKAYVSTKYHHHHYESSLKSLVVSNDIIIAIVSTFFITSFVMFYLLVQWHHPIDYGTGTADHEYFFEKYHQSSSSSLLGDSSLSADMYDDEEERLGLERLPWNPTYRIPESMITVGDRSNSYTQLRRYYDTKVLPKNEPRSIRYIQEHIYDDPHHQPYIQLQNVPIPPHNPNDGSNIYYESYDIYHCPYEPPMGYPYQWNLLSILDNWVPDNVSVPESNQIYHGLCIFDYTKDYDKAKNYRTYELPFIVVNDPSVARTVERWNTPHYIEQMLGRTPHRTEYSENNHFMYYVPPTKLRHPNQQQQQARRRNTVVAPEGWKAPTKSMRMSYVDWYQHATATTDVTSPNRTQEEMEATMVGPDQPHWYYRLIGCGGMGNDGSCDKDSSEYLFDELTFFQPKESLYIVEPKEQKGIHCRFGMSGVIAENHFDHSRNAIVMLSGQRRYVLTNPNQCQYLTLYPKGHPSARHSAIDWSNPQRRRLDLYPEFALATGNEVILQPGQIMYLPTDWFHFIVSLDVNIQCNTRSGITDHFQHDLAQCGF